MNNSAQLPAPLPWGHKKHLKCCLAVCEHHINLKRITPKFIAQLVAARQSVT